MYSLFRQLAEPAGDERAHHRSALLIAAVPTAPHKSSCQPDKCKVSMYGQLRQE
jgi:hypothetical protein